MAALVVPCVAFLVSAVWLYLANSAQQQQMYRSKNSPTWISYQAQIEHLNLQSLLRACAADVGCPRARLKRQLDSFATRIEQLRHSDGFQYIQNAPQYASQLEQFSRLAKHYVRKIDLGAATIGRRTLAVLTHQITPLAPVLQAVLSETALHIIDSRPRGEIIQTVIEADDTNSSLAFILLVVSGVGLILILTFQVRRGHSLLGEISALRDAERDSHAGMVDLLEALPVPVLVVASNNSVFYANRAAKAFARPPHGSRDAAELAAVVRQNFGPLGADGSALRNFPLFHSDGSLRHLSVVASRIRLLKDRVKVYVISDNTLLRDAELRAMTAGKLAILGELSSAIAHELNQPLAVIKAAAANGKLQASGFMGAERVVDKFTRIDGQIERTRRIIDNVRKLGRPVQGDDAPFNVARSLESTLGLVSQQYRLAGVALDIDIELADGVTVTGSPTLFEIAILNVLLNAREAFVRRDEGADPPAVRVRARHDHGSVLIVVSDNAGGIPRQILSRVFDSFVSSKSADTGTGLGLSITRRAVEGMRGSITAENAGPGAVFRITLPALLQKEVACQRQLS